MPRPTASRNRSKPGPDTAGPRYGATGGTWCWTGARGWDRVAYSNSGTTAFGTVTDEATAFAILDQFVGAGGTFVDTSDNYAFWVNGTQGGESEALLGRWRQSRGIGNEIVIATKRGARPLAPGTSFLDNAEGLSAAVIRAAAAALGLRHRR